MIHKYNQILFYLRKESSFSREKCKIPPGASHTISFGRKVGCSKISGLIQRWCVNYTQIQRSGDLYTNPLTCAVAEEWAFSPVKEGIAVKLSSLMHQPNTRWSAECKPMEANLLKENTGTVSSDSATFSIFHHERDDGKIFTLVNKTHQIILLLIFHGSGWINIFHVKVKDSIGHYITGLGTDCRSGCCRKCVHLKDNLRIMRDILRIIGPVFLELYLPFHFNTVLGLLFFAVDFTFCCLDFLRCICSLSQLSRGNR